MEVATCFRGRGGRRYHTQLSIRFEEGGGLTDGDRRSEAGSLWLDGSAKVMDQCKSTRNTEDELLRLLTSHTHTVSPTIHSHVRASSSLQPLLCPSLPLPPLFVDLLTPLLCLSLPTLSLPFPLSLTSNLLSWKHLSPLPRRGADWPGCHKKCKSPGCSAHYCDYLTGFCSVPCTAGW